MYCGKCGTQIDDNALFCTNCGEKTLNSNKSTQQTTKTNIKKNFQEEHTYA